MTNSLEEFLKKPLIQDLWRAPTDNDFGFKMSNKLGVWKEATKNQVLLGLNEAKEDHVVFVRVSYNLPAIQDAKVELNYKIAVDGTIEVETKSNNVKEKSPIYPR